MRTTIRQRSVSKGYFLIAAIMLGTLALLAIWVTWSNYQVESHTRQQLLNEQAARLHRELQSDLEYVSHLMGLFGEEIAQQKNPSLKYIAALLRGKLITNQVIKEQFSWTVFDWSDPNAIMRVSTPFGILKKPRDITHRYYAKMASVEPWVLHFDPASVGIPSGQWIIPAGMGISDKNGKPIGILSVGFNIDRLTKRLTDMVAEEHIHFVVLDSNHNVTLSSGDGKIAASAFKSLLKGILPTNGQGKLPTSIEYGGITYSQYSYLDDYPTYPYIILVGYNTALANQSFQQKLLPGVISYAIIAFVSLAILLFLRFSLVKPLVNLSNVADKISRGEKVKRIRGGFAYETSNLALQLLKVKRFIRQQQRLNELKEWKQAAKASEEEKENFIRNMYQILSVPLTALRNGVQVMRDESLGALSVKNYGDIFDAMSDAVSQLENYTTEFLYPDEVHVKHVIDRCIRIYKRRALEGRIALIAPISDDIPVIWADPLRLQQVILGILYHSVSYTPENGQIRIQAHTTFHANGSPDALTITIHDNGFGFDEEKQERFKKTAKGKADKSVMPRDPDMTKLEMSIIRHLIRLHHGTFELVSKLGAGTTYTIKLPYLTQDELDTHPDVAEAQITENSYQDLPGVGKRTITGEDSKNKHGASNIISFSERKKNKNSPDGGDI